MMDLFHNVKRFFKALALFLLTILVFVVVVIFYHIGVNLLGTPFVITMLVLCLGSIFYSIYSDVK